MSRSFGGCMLVKEGALKGRKVDELLGYSIETDIKRLE